MSLEQEVDVSRPRDDSIQWGPCTKYNFSVPLECGSLPVPLDYTDPTVGTLDLEILRLKSNSDVPKGSIFLNFGGPGDNGRDSLEAFGTLMQSMTGGCYDMITIVPRYVSPAIRPLFNANSLLWKHLKFEANLSLCRRGTNDTLLFNCYASDAARAAAPVSLNGNSSDVAIDNTWAESTVFTQTCAVNQNETGRYVGTAFTARDHKAVLDAIGEKYFRYWGKQTSHISTVHY
jgi:hypothetical protein